MPHCFWPHRGVAGEPVFVTQRFHLMAFAPTATIERSDATHAPAECCHRCQSRRITDRNITAWPEQPAIWEMPGDIDPRAGHGGGVS
jgi:hypothetical protein